MLHVNESIGVPLRELEFSFARSSGPGGQNVNKVNTKATLRWNVRRTKSISDDVRQRFLTRFRRRINRQGELVMHSQRFRDQGRNVADCLAKLREMLERVADAAPPRKRKKRSRAAHARRLHDKKTTARKKELRRSPELE